MLAVAELHVKYFGDGSVVLRERVGDQERCLHGGDAVARLLQLEARAVGFVPSADASLEEVERWQIERAIEDARRDALPAAEVARRLGVHPSTLKTKRVRYDL